MILATSCCGISMVTPGNEPMIMIPVRFCKNFVLFLLLLLYCRVVRDASVKS